MNERTNMTDELDAAEGLIAGGQADLAVELLERLAADAEEYVDRNCPTTDEVQWFSFPTIFERLCYRRVEKDPRELRDVGEPLDRLYADLAFALVNEGDYAAATEALRQAVRWNPMGCGYRLDLAELYRTNGDADEYLALTFSVFERASDVRHLVRAFCNFARHFMDMGADSAAAAALRCARRLDWPDVVLEDLLERAKGTRADPDSLSDEQASSVLAENGLPDGANAEVALCMLMCATDSAASGDRTLATALTVRARDLVGAPAVKALLELIRSTDAEDGGDGHADA
ncbi:hypothetical protein [Parolsenella catena]|uniref:hypothetical protein n=1 Tax=Parolsenella catena TaxID=2003188 RepID=UPI0029432B37|nr:hypothetical protein [Parolsenella catena]